MSVEGQTFDTRAAFEQNAMEIAPATPEIQQVAPPMRPANDRIYEAPTLEDQVEFTGLDLNSGGVLGEFCNQVGSAVTELGAQCNHLLPEQPVQEITASINGGPQMEVQKNYQPDYTMPTPSTYSGA